MIHDMLVPYLWANKIMATMKNAPQLAPSLPEDVRALLVVANAEYQWSQFSMCWMVKFKRPSTENAYHAVLVGHDEHNTLEKWADLCVKIREQMAVEYG